MSQEIIDRVKQRLVDGSLTKEQAAMVLSAIKTKRTPEQTEELRLKRLDEVPEIGSGTGLLSGQPATGRAAVAAALPVTLKPQELAQILESQFPGVIGVAQTPEGRLIARNNQTGAVAELNKPGLSPLDAAQMLGVGSAFFPSGAGVAGTGVKTLGTLAARSAATQGVIEGGQAAAGGEFNPEQVAVEAVAAPVSQLGIEKVVKPAAKAGLSYFATKAKAVADAAADRASQLRSYFEAGDQPIEDAVRISTRGSSGEIVEMMAPDANFYRAAEELGISAEPLASYASKNPQYRDIEMALSSIPGSSLDAQGKAFITETSKKADDLIQEYGGSLDKGAVSEGFRQQSIDVIRNLESQADIVYQSLDELIPRQTPVEANNTLAFINQKASELGGVDKLSPRMKKLLKDLTPKVAKDKKRFDYSVGTVVEPGQVTLPTHALLSQRRRDVGQAMKSSNFRSEEQGLLKALYGRLASDQDQAASQFSREAAAASESGKSLIIQRKQLEDNLKSLIGDDFSKSVVEVVGSSIKNLPKKGIRQFTNRLQEIPEDMRSSVVMTALNDIFRGSGSNQQALNATQFTKFMDDLNRQPSAKNALFGALPEQSIRAIENLYTVSKGISNANLQKVPTGRVLSMFKGDSSLMRKLMGKPAAFIAGKAVGGGPQGLAAGALVDEFLSQNTGKAKAVSELLGSPQFQDMIKKAVREGNIEGGQVSRQLEIAEKNLAKSASFKKWADTLDNETLGRLMRGVGTGMSAYFIADQ